MTRQLSLEDFEGIGRIVPTDIYGEMQRSYMEYAMSVIVGRALPDVRDGLKPVHRRILYAMHELGLTPERPFRKCARVVGDVLGKYHPHGDQAVYDALVRMVQDFSSRYPLVSGHGNFGSVDNDPPAAMRYTECRLSGLSHRALLSEIGEDIVEFMPNFDGSQAEPTVLPAQLPLLLLNGSSGIAVGMATNIPPHNFGELVDGLLVLIDQPDCTVADLMKKIPGPDFPTGGQIVGPESMVDTYTSGRGLITLRGVAQFEEIPAGRGRHRRNAIVITEFPFQVNKAAWIEKVAELTNQESLQGISDLRDESDRTGIRVVIELRRDANPQKVLQQLFKRTPLQTNFGVIMLALVDGEPRQMGLKEILHHFLDFRITTLLHVFTSELEKVRHKAEEVAAMLLALADLDTVIDLLRRAPDGTTAKQQLQETLGCNASQADTILSMPLRRLTGLERERLQQEQETLQTRIEELEGLLSDRRKLLNHLKKELRSLKKTFTDPRRTEIKTAADLEAEEVQVPSLQEDTEAEVFVQITQKGYIRRLPVPKRRGRSRFHPRDPVGDDPILQVWKPQIQQELLVLTRSGRAFTLKVGDIPLTTGQARGTPLVTLLPTPEPICTSFCMEGEISSTELIVLSEQGRLKRVKLEEFTNLTNRGSAVMRLKDGDELGWAILYIPDRAIDATLIIATSGGRFLRMACEEDQVPLMGRTALGTQALRLHRRETIVGMALLLPATTLVVATRQGYVKRMDASVFPVHERGSIGVQGITFKRKSDTLSGITTTGPADEIGLESSSGQLSILSPDQCPKGTRTDAGSQLFKPEGEDHLAQIYSFPPLTYEGSEQ